MQGREREQEGEEEKGKENPYFFGKECFTHTARTQHGHFKVLERFSKRSELLRGIDSYRLAILKTEPNTFVLPSHWDAEEVLYVVKGACGAPPPSLFIFSTTLFLLV